ncbi:VOC family protein [Priestia endophytica]|uniref:hypothetical protein n=1 Tax=Priestia endophytica TaxID=135735 RepID=UPI001CEF5D2F|nr:hypothetical protein [Priestia endophytica]
MGFVTEKNIKEVPVTRTGTLGALTFVYIRHLDQNLIEVSQFVKQKDHKKIPKV